MNETGKRRAVVTGAAGGLGAAIAERLARDGLAVALVDIKDMSEAVGRIRAAGGEAEGYLCDITDPDAVARLAEQVETRFGGCDVLMNNAGRYENRSFDELSFEHWRKVMALNLDGMFLMAKAFAPGMRARGWGRIVNMASNSAFLAPAGMAQYVASKSGAIGLARALGAEFGPDGVTVNAIAPGPIVTEQVRHSYVQDMGGDPDMFDDFMTALAQNQSIRRPGMPGDVVGLVSFLASDDAGFITTQTIICDGGWARV